jgi:hypothetical protein
VTSARLIVDVFEQLHTPQVLHSTTLEIDGHGVAFI